MDVGHTSDNWETSRIYKELLIVSSVIVWGEMSGGYWVHEEAFGGNQKVFLFVVVKWMYMLINPQTV